MFTWQILYDLELTPCWPWTGTNGELECGIGFPTGEAPYEQVGNSGLSGARGVRRERLLLRSRLVVIGCDVL